jgi:hypothetical protein
MANKRAQACRLFDANAEHRFAISHFRSPAERSIVMLAASVDPEQIRLEQNPLRGQSAATLSVWTCEELERTLKSAE